MKMIVGYETSGMVREAFRALGHDAWSCDLLPAEDNSPFHMQCDIWEALAAVRWDFGIFHPECTYLCISAAWAFKDGPYHQKVKEGTLVGAARRRMRDHSLAEVRKLMALPFPWVIENPVGAISTFIRKPDQIIQPWQFGHNASKATCLWLSDGLPHVVPSGLVQPRIVNGKRRWGNQTDSGQNRETPSDHRWKDRARTYPGIAAAFAKAWGGLKP